MRRTRPHFLAGAETRRQKDEAGEGGQPGVSLCQRLPAPHHHHHPQQKQQHPHHRRLSVALAPQTARTVRAHLLSVSPDDARRNLNKWGPPLSPHV